MDGPFIATNKEMTLLRYIHPGGSKDGLSFSLFLRKLCN